MTRDLVRLRAVRRADALDDQKSAAAIATATSASTTQEDYQQYVLSQLKRIIHGDNPGQWLDDFLAANIPSLSSTLREIEVAFDHTLSGALDFGTLAPGDSVVGVQLVIDQPFDDPAALISLGLVSNPDGILSTANIDPNVTSTYGAQENFLVREVDALRLKVFPFTSTQGAGRVVALVG